MPQHPQRRLLDDEIRARPYKFLKPPVQVSHLAVLSGEHGGEADNAHAAALCGAFGAEPPEAGANHYSGDLGPFHFKWERHTEFSSYTFYNLHPPEDPFAGPAIELAPAEWLAAMPGQVLAATHLAVEGRDAAERPFDRLAALFADKTFAGSRVNDGRARVWTDFRIQDDGFTRILVHDGDLNERQLGRLVQRLLEIVSYRMLALLAFPLAVEVRPQVAAAEQALSGIVADLAGIEDNEDERGLLKKLSRLAAEAETLSTATAYRFSAAGAYYSLLRRRIDELREDRIEGLQPPGEFLFRRLIPAMETCKHTAARQQSLSERIAHAGDLLRTRVNVALEEQNRDLLESMDRRAQLQMRLQETVKGLSIVAISYYLLSMTYYLAKSAKAGGLKIDPEFILGPAFPAVIGIVWLGAWWIKRMRKTIMGEEDGGK